MSQESTQNVGTVGIELASSALTAVKVDQTGQVLAEYVQAFDPDMDTVPQIADFLKKAESELGSFEQFGFAVPGLVDTTANKVVRSFQFPEHEVFDLASEIAAASGKKAYLENDANAAAYGELICGAGLDAKDLFYITVGVGIGGALVLDRKLWHGVSGFAGEFGFVAVDGDGTKLEDVASAEGIVRRAQNRIHQDTASSLLEVGEENITFEDIIAAANNEDGLAELIIERTGMYLGMAVANVINLLNIEKIIIGGDLMDAGDLVLESIRKRAAEYSSEPGFTAVKIEKGLLGHKASAVGSALLVRNR